MMKKLFAAATLAYALAIPAAGAASADGHNVGDETWSCPVGTCSGQAWGAPDGYQVRDASITPAINEGDLAPAVEAIDTATVPPHNNAPVASYPAEPKNLPKHSWPGFGFGVDDTK